MRILSKIILLLAVSLSTLLAGNIPASWVHEYEITIKRLELYNSTSGKWITISGAPATVDIASANPGQSIAGMIAEDAAITYGVYTKARAVVGNTFKIKACGAVNGKCTTGAPMYAGTSIFALTQTGLAVPQEATVVVDFSTQALPAGVTLIGTDIALEYTLPTPITINENSTAPSITVSFDVDNVLTYDVGMFIYPDFPNVDIQVK